MKQLKEELKNIALGAKLKYSNDKPLIRMIINDYLDYICKEEHLTEKQRGILSNYACKLHPKN